MIYCCKSFYSSQIYLEQVTLSLPNFLCFERHSDESLLPIIDDGLFFFFKCTSKGRSHISLDFGYQGETSRKNLKAHLKN